MIHLREATPEDIAHVGAHMRAADVAELRASGHDNPALAVQQSADNSVWINSVLAGDEVAAVYGVTLTNIEGVASPWMLGTDAIRNVKREFLRASIGEVDRMMAGNRALFNRVHGANAVSIAWLRWLGFTVDDQPDGEFFQFWKVKTDV